MKLTGSQVIAEVLLEHDVHKVFGYPGGAALNVYDALYEYKDQIKHITTAHEQGATHAADGYARATGKTGVVFATSGPGATNLVTGLATAFMDSIPLVAITSNVPDSLIGRDAFQEICITGVTMPITKHNYFINKIEDLPDALNNAFRIAESGRKGPVLVDVTKDVSAQTINYKPGHFVRTEPVVPEVDMEKIKEIAEIINSAKRPVVYLGGGAANSEAADEVNAFVQKGALPVAHTIMAAGIIGHENPKSLGLLGMHGTVAANKAFDKADVMIALGTRFSDRVALNPKKFAKRATKIQVDIDRSEINKNVIVDQGIISDVKDFLTKIMPLIETKDRKDWLDELANLKKEKNDEKSGVGDLYPSEIIGATCDLTDKDTIYVTDVGQHQMWAAQYLRHNNTKRFLTSGGLGTMGYGYGAAIGAQIGCPDKRVIHFTGDGSFHMNLNEACTAVSENLPIITIIMNNGVLGMVYQWQTSFYGSRYSNTDPERKTNFAKVGEGFGARTFTVSNQAEFEKAFREALKEKGPSWIDCHIAKDERVSPMIPPGGTTDDMIIG